jgi:hypothetical protein
MESRPRRLSGGEGMTERYELVETKYDGEREVHISNVSWVMANALKDILEDKCAGRLTVEEMTNAARAALGEKE